MIRVGSNGAVVLRPGPAGHGILVAVILPGSWMSADLVNALCRRHELLGRPEQLPEALAAHIIGEFQPLQEVHG